MLITPKILISIGYASEALDTVYPIWRVIEEGYESAVAAEKRVYHAGSDAGIAERMRMLRESIAQHPG